MEFSHNLGHERSNELLEKLTPDDPLYGQRPPPDDGMVFLGDLAFKGEQGLLKLPPEWLLRMRYNPFYDYLQKRVLQWADDAGKSEL